MTITSIVLGLLCVITETPIALTTGPGQGQLGRGLNAKTASEKPVPGSKILSTTYEVKAGSATEFVVNGIISLEGVVGGLTEKKGPETKKNEETVKKIVSSILDLDILGRRALITYWEDLGKTAKGKKLREKYLTTFKQLVEENYMEKARAYVSGKYQIPLMKETTTDKMTIVEAQIKKKDVDLIVEFFVTKEAGSWKVIDIKLDDTSLEGTYRSSFNRIIKKKGGVDAGLPELLSVMEKRLQELRKGKATSL